MTGSRADHDAYNQVEVLVGKVGFLSSSNIQNVDTVFALP